MRLKLRFVLVLAWCFFSGFTGPEILATGATLSTGRVSGVVTEEGDLKYEPEKTKERASQESSNPDSNQNSKWTVRRLMVGIEGSLMAKDSAAIVREILQADEKMKEKYFLALQVLYASSRVTREQVTSLISDLSTDPRERSKLMDKWIYPIDE